MIVNVCTTGNLDVQQRQIVTSTVGDRDPTHRLGLGRILVGAEDDVVRQFAEIERQVGAPLRDADDRMVVRVRLLEEDVRVQHLCNKRGCAHQRPIGTTRFGTGLPDTRNEPHPESPTPPTIDFHP